jgi:hypothetical protein
MGSEDTAGERSYGRSVMVVAGVAAVVVVASVIIFWARGGGPETDAASEISLSVVPSDQVKHGERLDAEGAGFRDGARIGIGICTEDVLDTGDLNACDMATVRNALADDGGRFAASIDAKAVISTGNRGVVDCSKPEEACILGATDIDDSSDMVGVNISIDPTSVPPPPSARITADDLDKSPPTVSVAGTGYRPDGDVRVAICLANDAGGAMPMACDHDQGQLVRSTPEGTFEATLVVRSFSTADGEVVDCLGTPQRCVVTTALPPTQDLPVAVGLG